MTSHLLVSVMRALRLMLLRSGALVLLVVTTVVIALLLMGPPLASWRLADAALTEQVHETSLPRRPSTFLDSSMTAVLLEVRRLPLESTVQRTVKLRLLRVSTSLVTFATSSEEGNRSVCVKSYGMIVGLGAALLFSSHNLRDGSRKSKEPFVSVLSMMVGLDLWYSSLLVFLHSCTEWLEFTVPWVSF